MKIVVAGASGFIGSRLIQYLSSIPEVDHIFALSRAGRTGSDSIEWRKVDLADLTGLNAAVEGADLAIYLVHSMSPQARMSQGSFEDFDLLQADNFARACRTAEVRDIIYLGGIVQDENIARGNLSAHLRSRIEVENVLGAYGSRVTAMRAGLILGAGGSSSEMLVRLVRRLPIMLVPSWTLTESEPVDVADVVTAIGAVVRRPELRGHVWDVAGPERLSYRELMARVANMLGLHRRFIPLPAISPTVSKLWVSLISGAPRALVYPLVKSLTHSMVSREDRRILDHIRHHSRPLSETLRDLSRDEARDGRFPSTKGTRETMFAKSTVRSVQRIPNLTAKRKAELGSLADHYFRWLPRSLFGFLSVKKIENGGRIRIRFLLRFTSLSLLELEAPAPLKVDGAKSIERFSIAGGILQTRESGGHLEFRWIAIEECGLSIVQDFVPRLPWAIYRFTQAVLHHFVMHAFSRSLQRE